MLLATVDLGFDRQGWITVFAALLLALITLLSSYNHVDFLGAASIDLPQQAGIPCIAAAVATAIEQQVGVQRSTSTWSATRSSKRSNSSTISTPNSVQSCPAPAPARALRPQCQASERCDCAVGRVRGNGLNVRFLPPFQRGQVLPGVLPTAQQHSNQLQKAIHHRNPPPVRRLSLDQTGAGHRSGEPHAG